MRATLGGDGRGHGKRFVMARRARHTAVGPEPQGFADPATPSTLPRPA